MSLPTQLNAALAGRYEIEREIGKGGMATVYLARDLKHGRRVALKLLDPELGAVLGADRFLSEIRVTANLQHPNLLPLFDSGEANGMLFYVMPFIEGESLRARLDREKQLPIDEAVRIATAVASALDYAHRHAVIHRDLKPENILLNDGQPLIADFGIALAVSNAGGARVTQTGLSLGTPQYMSPEQATGDRGIDGRTDIYSLGAVTYEMLCGEPPHHGNTAQAIIAKLMTEDPRPLTTLRRTVPPHVDDAVRCALEKLPADRFATAREFCDAIVGARPSPTIRTTSRAPKKLSRQSLALLVIPWVIAAGAVAFAAWKRPAAAPDVPTTRTWIDLPDRARFDIQPFMVADRNGRFVVFRASLNRINQFFIRRLDDPQTRIIPGTTDAYLPFLSPDGAWFGFVMPERLVRVPIAGGTPVTIARLGPNSAPACSWGLDDVIVCGGTQGLRKVSGGALVPFTTADTSRGELGHRSPRFLADGKTIAFVVARAGDNHLAFVRPDGTISRSSISGVAASGLADDIVLYSTTDGVLFATAFDAARLTPIGAAIPVAEGLIRSALGAPFWSVSPNGTLAYVAGTTARRLVRVTRSGSTTPLIDDLRPFRRPVISPDGSRIALETVDPIDIWVYSLAARTLTKLGSPPGSSDPLWSPDGKRMLYTSAVDPAGRHIEWRNADGTGVSERLITATAGTNLYAIDWTPDGRTLIYDENRRNAPATIRALEMATRTSREVLAAQSTVRLPSMSPDGQWMAYESAESGQKEIYVAQYPGPGGRWQVSDRGGAEPIWAPNGREIFYRAPRSMMAATVDTRGGKFAVTGRVELFEDDFSVTGTLMHDLFPDGSFAMLQAAEERRLTLVSNIIPELREKLGLTRK